MRRFLGLLVAMALLGCGENRPRQEVDGAGADQGLGGAGGKGGEIGEGGDPGFGGVGGNGSGGLGGMGAGDEGGGGGVLENCVRPPSLECKGPFHLMCDGKCLDVSHDPKACGACGRACEVGEGCFEGDCRRSCDEAIFINSFPPWIKLSQEEADGLAVGDLDGDGVLEIVVALPTDRKIAILSQSEGRTLKAPRFYDLSSRFNKVVIMDVDRDGWPDLVLSSYQDSRVSMLIGGKDGFANETILTDEIRKISKMQVADLNGDGLDDLVVGSFTGALAWFPGLPNGGLGDMGAMSIANDYDWFIYDLDLDGIIDILALSGSEKELSVLWGDGTGNFTMTAIQFHQVPYDVQVLSTESLPGLVAGESGVPNQILRFDQSRPRNFERPVIVNEPYDRNFHLRLVDLDGDGMPELITTPTFKSRLQVEPLGSNAGYAPVLYQTIGWIKDLVARDLDGDGRVDLIVSGSSGYLSVFYQEGSSSFRSGRDVDIGSRVVELLPGDFDEDGLEDVVLIRNRGAPLEWRQGGGERWRNVVEPLGPELFASSGAVGDFNVDGHFDVAIVEGIDDGSLVVFLGDGKGSFKEGHRSVIGYIYKLVTADFDGDGILDLAATANTQSTVHILRGLGDGTFEPFQAIKVRDYPGGLVAADLDGDGWTDLAVARNASSRVSLLYNDGQGRLTPCKELVGKSGPLSIVSADVNGDGLADLVVGSWNGRGVTMHLQQSDGSWLRRDFSLSDGVRQVLVSDLDGDGRMEILAAQGEGRLDILSMGDDDELFWRESTGLGGSVYSAAVIDMDGDGLPDLVAGAEARLRLVNGSCGYSTLVPELE